MTSKYVYKAGDQVLIHKDEDEIVVTLESVDVHEPDPITKETTIDYRDTDGYAFTDKQIIQGIQY